MNDTRLWVADLLSAFSGQENTLTIPRAYIDITGNIEDALLLSQVIYWTDRTKMDDGWFAKSYSEWKDEIALSKYQVMSATKRLKVAGVETIVRKFNGAPTVHYRLLKSEFELWIVKKLDERKLRNSTNDSKETLQSSTEPTPEPTPENKSAEAQHSTSNTTIVTFPKSLKSYTAEHVLAYQSLHATDMTALVKAWQGDMYNSITEFATKIGRMYIEVHQELSRLQKPNTDYLILANHTKKKDAWKDSHLVTDMLLYITEYCKVETGVKGKWDDIPELRGIKEIIR